MGGEENLDGKIDETSNIVNEDNAHELEKENESSEQGTKDNTESDVNLNAEEAIPDVVAMNVNKDDDINEENVKETNDKQIEAEVMHEKTTNADNIEQESSLEAAMDLPLS